MSEIKALRTQLGMTQRVFAAEFYLNIRTLQQWEQEISQPPTFLVPLIKRIIKDEKVKPVK